MLMTTVLASLASCLVAAAQCEGFTGFWTSNYNETISICIFDQKALLARTHWPGLPFNEDSAAIMGVQGANESGSIFFTGSGSSSHGQYTFSMILDPDCVHSQGEFTWLSKNGSGAWIWARQRPTLDSECALVLAAGKEVSPPALDPHMWQFVSISLGGFIVLVGFISLFCYCRQRKTRGLLYEPNGEFN